MHQITELCVKSESWGREGGRGRLIQSHVMAELKACWRVEVGEEEEEGMEGQMRKAGQERKASQMVSCTGVCSTLGVFPGVPLWSGS